MSGAHPYRRLSARLAFSLLALPAAGWGAMALFYRAPWPYLWVGLWSLGSLALLILLWRRPPLKGAVGLILAFAVLLLWWHSVRPSNDRVWADDVARMTHGEIIGDQLRLDNVRNFNWRSDQDYDIRWESRQYDLGRLKSVDLLTSYWGLPAIAHILVSFGFSDGRQLVFTVEIRKERQESFSEVAGFFKEFELSIVATDERDAVRVRSNVRGEDVYLYHINMPQPMMRELLQGYVQQANRLTRRPRFYNTLTANCTTIVYDMAQNITGRQLPSDYRLLLTGYLPGYLEDLGVLQQGFSLPQLRALGRITQRAKAADQAPDFSARIRAGVPGW